MDEQLKEILQKLKDKSIEYPYGKSRKDIDLLLDYITNLQQINKNLTNSLNKKVEEGINLQQENERLTNELNTCMIERNNFLSRNEKAMKENELLKEQVIELKNAINNCYGVMIGLDVITNFELNNDKIEVL